MKKIKILGIIWLLGMILIAPVLFLIGGWTLVIAYLTCKFTGVCPI